MSRNGEKSKMRCCCFGCAILAFLFVAAIVTGVLVIRFAELEIDFNAGDLTRIENFGINIIEDEGTFLTWDEVWPNGLDNIPVLRFGYEVRYTDPSGTQRLIRVNTNRMRLRSYYNDSSFEVRPIIRMWNSMFIGEWTRGTWTDAWENLTPRPDVPEPAPPLGLAWVS